MLTNLIDVKNYLGITDTSEDGLINLLIPMIQQTIETYCHRVFEVTSYLSEQHNINHKIFPYQTPIISVENIVRLDGNIIDTIPDCNDPVNYRVFPGYIDLLDYMYVTMGDKLKYVNNEQSYIEVSYTAGYAVVPPDLELAAIKLIALEYKDSTEDRIGLVSSSEGSVHEIYIGKGINTEMPLSISGILDRYSRVCL
jgi:hypothetical protein